MNTGTQTRIKIDDNSFIHLGSPENYAYKEKNLSWQLPQVQANLEAEATQKNSAQTLGLTVSQTSGSSFLGGHAGVAYFKNYDRWAWRLDLNLRLTNVKYQFNYFVETHEFFLGGRSYTDFYQESAKKTFWTPELAVTLNTSNGDWPVNYFLNLTTGSQKFYDLENQHGVWSDKDSYLNLSVGIHRKITHKKRLVLGLGTSTHRANYDHGSSRLWHIIAQIDLM